MFAEKELGQVLRILPKNLVRNIVNVKNNKMRSSFFTYEEDEAYREGRRDESYHRNNYDYDKYSDSDIDSAYYKGREDERREMEREERCRAEREMEEREERLAYERYMDLQQEQALLDQQQELAYLEQQQVQAYQEYLDEIILEEENQLEMPEDLNDLSQLNPEE
jgi:hypothetical protein